MNNLEVVEVEDVAFSFKGFNSFFKRKINPVDMPYISTITDVKDKGFSDSQKSNIINQYVERHNANQEQLDYKQRLTNGKYSVGGGGLFALNDVSSFKANLQKAIDRDYELTNLKMIENYVKDGFIPIFMTYSLKPEHNQTDYKNILDVISIQKDIFSRRMQKLRETFRDNMHDIYTFELTKKFNVHAHILFFIKPDDVSSDSKNDQHFTKFLTNILKHNRNNKYIGSSDISFLNQSEQNKGKEILFKGEKAIWNVGNQTWVVPNTNNSLQITNTTREIHEVIVGESNMSKISRVSRYIFKYISKDSPCPMYLANKIYNVDLSKLLANNKVNAPLIERFFSYNLIPTIFNKKDEDGYMKEYKIFNSPDTRFKRDFKLKFQKVIGDEEHDDLVFFLKRAEELNKSFYDESVSIETDDGSFLNAVMPFTNQTPIGNNTWHLILTKMPVSFSENKVEKVLDINGFKHIVSKNKVVSLTHEQAVTFDFDNLNDYEADLISAKTKGYDILSQNEGLNRAFLYNKNYVPAIGKSNEDVFKKVYDNSFDNHDLLTDVTFDLNNKFTGKVFESVNDSDLSHDILDIWFKDTSTIFVTKDNSTVFHINNLINKQFKKFSKTKQFKSLKKPVIFSKNIPEQNIVKSKVYLVNELGNEDFKVVLIDTDGKFNYCDKYVLGLKSCRPAFAITINNSQGRSINNVCFVQLSADYVDYSHFYTAISRSRLSFKFLITDAVYSRIVITAKGSTISFNKDNNNYSYCRNSIVTGNLLEDKSFNAFTKTTGIFNLKKQDAINFGFGNSDISNKSFRGLLLKINDKFNSLNVNEVTPFDRNVSNNLSEEQKDLCQSVLDNSVSVIRGDGGTGKTRTVKYLINHLVENCFFDKEDIKVVAFTNSAVDVLREHIEDCHLSTIHKFLGMGGNGKPSKVFNGEIIIVDETSMISLDLFYHLVSGLKAHQRIVFLGDYKQLPPVNTFPIFSYLNPTFTLTYNFRAERSSGDVENNVFKAIQEVIALKDDDIKFDNVQKDFHYVLNYFEKNVII